MHNTNTLPAVYNPHHGLNGFWGSLVRGLCDFAIGIVAGYVSAFPGGKAVTEKFKKWWDSTAVQNAFAFKGTSASTDLPANEQAFIKSWNDTYFIPWLTALTLELKAAVELTNPSARLAAMNIVYDKINIVTAHYDLYDTGILSDDGIQARNYLIETALTQLVEVIKDRAVLLGAGPGLVKAVPAKYSFAPLFTSTPLLGVTGVNYKMAAGAVATDPATATTTGTTTTATTQPGTVAGVKAAPIKSAISVISASPLANVVKTAATITLPVNATATQQSGVVAIETKSNTGIIIGSIAVVGAIIWYATRKKGKTAEKK